MRLGSAAADEGYRLLSATSRLGGRLALCCACARGATASRLNYAWSSLLRSVDEQVRGAACAICPPAARLNPAVIAPPVLVGQLRALLARPTAQVPRQPPGISRERCR